MAYKFNFVRVTAIGKLGNTEEIFSFGFHLSKLNANITEEEWNASAGGISNVADAIREFWVEPFNGIPNQWYLTSVKAALIATTGKYETFAVPHEFIFETPVPGPDVNGSAPQLAAVVTLNSAKPRDPGRYNRFYVPTRTATDANYVINNQTQQSLADTAVTMLLGIENVFNNNIPAITPAVVSASGSGHTNYVSQVRVGNIIDTQRRRRNKLQETYVIEQLQ